MTDTLGIMSSPKETPMYKSFVNVLKSSKAAVDLASIMVGIIVIGLIGAVVAATVFAIIPWAQDNAAKQQLQNVVVAESANSGLTEGRFSSVLPELMDLNAAQVAVFSDENKCYGAFKTSSTGKTFYLSSKTNQAKVVPTPWPSAAPADYPANCAWPTAGPFKSGNLFADPTYEKGTDWENYFGPTVSTEKTITHSPGTSRKIVTVNPYDGTIVWQNTITKGGTYTAGMWFKAEVGTSWHVALRTEGPYSEGAGGGLVEATGDWQYVSVRGTVNEANYSKIGMQIRAEGVSPGHIAYFDDASIYYMG